MGADPYKIVYGRPIAPKTLRSPSLDTLPDIRYEKDTIVEVKIFLQGIN
jgi:hypothetical protein